MKTFFELREEQEKKSKDDPCWKGYKQVGMKKGKDGKEVPNCVPNESVKEETLDEGSFAIHKNGKPMNIKGKPVTTTTKAAAEKAINTMMQKDFNKNAKFTVVQTDDKKKSVPAGAVKPRTTSDKEWKMAEIRRKHRSMPAWRRAERGE